MQKFENERWVRNKKTVFREIKMNYLINTFTYARIMQEKRNIIHKLKDYCNSQIAFRLNKMNYENKINNILKRKAKLKMKKYFKFYRECKTRTTLKVKIFYEICLKVKIFKFLKEFTRRSKVLTNNLAVTFRNTYLKYKLFKHLKGYYTTFLRESYIIHKLKEMYEYKNNNYKLKAFQIIKNFYKCEKLRRLKNLQLKIKLFYILKFFKN
jgi:hypothetical protein